MNKSPFARVAASLVVVAVLALLAQVGSAAFEGGKGNLSGTVQTADGKPAVGLNLKLVKDMPIDMRRPGKKRGTGIGDGAANGLQAGKERTKTVAQATTDQNGKFTMQNVPEGTYRLEAGNKNMGWIYQDVTVKPNETLQLNDLKLAKT